MSEKGIIVDSKRPRSSGLCSFITPSDSDPAWDSNFILETFRLPTVLCGVIFYIKIRKNMTAVKPEVLIGDLRKYPVVYKLFLQYIVQAIAHCLFCLDNFSWSLSSKRLNVDNGILKY